MAAVNPAESPTRPISPPEEEVTSEPSIEAMKPECCSPPTGQTTPGSTEESPVRDRGAAVGSDGAGAAISVESEAGTDKTTGPAELPALPEDVSEAGDGEDQKEEDSAGSETEDSDRGEEGETHQQSSGERGELTLF